MVIMTALAVLILAIRFVVYRIRKMKGDKGFCISINFKRKKDFNGGSYKHFLKAGQPIILRYNQSSCIKRILSSQLWYRGILGKGGR